MIKLLNIFFGCKLQKPRTHASHYKSHKRDSSFLNSNQYYFSELTMMKLYFQTEAILLQSKHYCTNLISIASVIHIWNLLWGILNWWFHWFLGRTYKLGYVAQKYMLGLYESWM